MAEMPISDYGLIGNTRSAALVSRAGSIDWCCLPRFDSDGVFARLLDVEGGHFQICPVEDFTSEQKYLEDTNILETTFHTTSGVVRLLDFFPVASEEDKKKELSPTHEILRIAECLSGKVELKYSFNPRPGFGKKKFKLELNNYGIRCNYGSECLVLLHDLQSREMHFKLVAGERRMFSLTYNLAAPGVILPLGESALIRLEKTAAYWREWISQCQYTGRYEEEVRRSALTLKLLVYSPSGAVLAAPTSSLPEEIAGVRNWDYRFCWLRDASFTIRSFLGLGFRDEARAYMGWILHSTALTRPRLKVLYTLYGESKAPEKIISWFSGYKNSRPVRTGNGADSQFQLDVYGEVMDAVYVYAPLVEKFDKETVTFLKGIADAVCELWRIPDEGIWEVRSGPVHHTHSKVMAFIALDRFMKLAEKYKWKIPLNKYQEVAMRIRLDVEQSGFNKQLNSYTLAYKDNDLDASLLTLNIYGTDLPRERMESTTFKILDRLTRKGLTYRYLHCNDGVNGGEGAFGACSFWMVESLARLGHFEKAEELMDEILERENRLGLWSEEIDPESNEYLGNYPQAFSHTALISAALSLQEKAP